MIYQILQTLTIVTALTISTASNAVAQAPKHPHTSSEKHWYPSKCCNEQHCGPVPCTDLQKQPDGSYLYLAPDLGKTITFTKPMIKPSPDESCHVCYRRKGEVLEGKPYCAYTKTFNMF